MEALNSMKELEAVVEQAIIEEEPLTLYIRMPEFPEPELITNPVGNLRQKLDYYKTHYDRNLKHKTATGVSIIAHEPSREPAMNARLERSFHFHDTEGGNRVKIKAVRRTAKEFAYLITDLCPENTEREVSLINLEQAMMWANSGIARG